MKNYNLDHSFCERELEHHKSRITYLEKQLQDIKEAYWNLEAAQRAIYELAQALTPFLKEEINNVCQEQCSRQEG